MHLKLIPEIGFQRWILLSKENKLLQNVCLEEKMQGDGQKENKCVCSLKVSKVV